MDAGGFEEFFRAMHPQLVRYAKRRLDSESALDAAALTMKTIWTKDLEAPADEIANRRLQSLAYRILEGHIRNTLRSQDRLSRLTSAVADTRRTEPVHVADIADLIVQPDDVEWMSRLSLTDREVLALIADGYVVAEIAVILDCSPAAVSMRLQRAKRNLKAILASWSDRD